eukprot:CAMPEP_0175934794 /NCGR_PEP_ID=MMETSP0108-20121206/20685_1 /TAXON_ID=195067 ORGANISM="Goniomonas pacifica, Strain CCMP1869" /NCGR_SAMPLE_ID=MMETSP0108 /ASSEMBLY_ACC=CAM_ASM_000204 /LENGTH=56 /DNA_ID=CAMNT_0017258667 /DNA_START=9 /DNA_END=176 /DNA_ORIENTATION=-
MSSQVEHLHTVVAVVGDECDAGNHVQRHTLRMLQQFGAQGPEGGAVGEAEHLQTVV